MKWKPICCVILLASIVLPAAPVMAQNGGTEVSGTVPLVTSNVSDSNIGYYGATIAWQTNGDATSQVFYDTVSHVSVDDYAQLEEDSNLVSEHSIRLSGLSSRTTYHYRVRSVVIISSVEYIAISEDYTFRTSGGASGGGGGGGGGGGVPPPGITDVSYILTSAGVFIREAIAESADGLCYLTIPKGTRGLTKEQKRLRLITIVEMEIPPPPPEDAYIIGLVYDFKPAGATFVPPIELTFSYDPADIPEGVAEEDLVIAYYDEEAGEWVVLESVVDTEANLIVAEIGHFTAFAVLGYEVVVPPVLPAAFTVRDLTVSPGEVYIGESASFSVIVANTGGESGSYEVTLKINGVVEEAKEITVTAGASKEVTFTTSKGEAGSYSVEVNGLSGSFTVKEKPAPLPLPPPPEKLINWRVLGAIIVGVVVVGLLIFFLLRRRRAV